MTKEEYIRKMEEDEEWAPRWDAIDDEFSRLYPNQEPSHYATNILDRAWIGAGGNEYLDGYSIYRNPDGYFHIVTYGMTELYQDPDAFGKEYSRWGYEMTMKVKENSQEDCLWVLGVMGNLARYTFQSERYFEAGHFVAGNGTSLHNDTDFKITGLVIVHDTSAKTQNTIHGKVEFLQLVGITTQEVAALRADINNVEKLIALMKKDNPELITDIKRDFDYL